MATVTIIISDDGQDGDRPLVGVHIESEPPFPLDQAGAPELDRLTPAQASAYAVVLGIQRHSGKAETYTQDGETITKLVPDDSQRRIL